MTRDRWVEKLRTIIGRVEAGEAPARVREIHVFGSFARGVLEPNDLDLIVLHDPPSEETLAPLLKAVDSYSYDRLDQACKAERRFEAAMTKIFRRGSERMDVRLAATLDEALSGMVFPRDEVRLLWSNDDRGWEARVAAIELDAGAGRHPRHHFIDPKKAGCCLTDVESVTKMIDDGVLRLDRLRLDGIDPQLSREFQRWCDHWTQCKVMGSAALKVLPWAMWWVQEQGAKRPRLWDHGDVGDENRRVRAAIGRMYPYYVYTLFRLQPKLVRQCLILHRRVREENWMYVFERGPHWEAAGEDEW